MKPARSQRLFIYLEPVRKARIVSAAGRSGKTLSAFMAEATEQLIDGQDGVRDQLAPFVVALEAMRDDLRYDLRTFSNQTAEENRVLRKHMREFMETQTRDQDTFLATQWDRQAKVIQVAVATALQSLPAQTKETP